MRVNRALYRHWPLSLAIVAVPLAGGAACTGLFDNLSLAPRDGGPATSSDAGACTPRVPPSAPNVDASGGSLELVFATTYTDYGLDRDDAGQWRYETLGFDLDSRCTSLGDSPACVEPPWAQSMSHTDGVDGIDNALGAILASQFGPVTMAAQRAAEKGHTSLLRLRGYSGAPDDDQVNVALYVGLGLVDGGMPMSDGHDVWTLHRDMLALGTDGGPDIDQPKFHDDAAYVTNHVLVVHLADSLGGPGKPLAPDYLEHYTQVILTARLTQDQGLWELQDGMWGGRQPIRDGLISMGYNAIIGQPSQPTCSDPSIYGANKAKLCQYVDVSSAPDMPGSLCDAISFGTGFGAVQAQLGPIGPPPTPPAPCADTVHPETDTCGP